MTTIRIDARRISDEKSFHDVFASACAFPSVYGRNLDAWVDCMGDLLSERGALVLQLDHVDDFARQCPGLFQTLLDCTAFVNWRRSAGERKPTLALAYSRKTLAT